MSPRFEIIPAKRYHCGQISRRLRPQQREALERTGASMHHRLIHLFNLSEFKRTWMIDGEIGALFGVTGGWLEPCGYVWLVISNKGAEYPVAFLRETRRQLDAMMASKRVLETTVIDGHDEALRLAAFLGFYVGPPATPGAPAFSSRGRRRLVLELKTNPDLLIPTGLGLGIQMGYSEASLPW
jgi:hypothetical protein